MFAAAAKYMSQPPSLQLYSVYYKPFPFYPTAGYVTPIQAGAAVLPRLPILGDDTGDHISDRNRYYSELTAAYWIYKNAPRNTDAWGLCHYRRYLIPLFKRFFIKPKSRLIIDTDEHTLDRLLTPALQQHLQGLLTTHDVIVQRPVTPKEKGRKIFTIKEAYYHDHIPAYWDTMMQVVVEKYPEYKTSIEPFGELKRMWFNNVMIARWEVWDAYLSWLFSILFEVEQRIQLPEGGYQERVFGFLAERLHNLFVFHNNLKAAHLTLTFLREP